VLILLVVCFRCPFLRAMHASLQYSDGGNKCCVVTDRLNLISMLLTGASLCALGYLACVQIDQVSAC
jgi:hypothetical protein